jgi:hypothetical protein
MLLIYGDEAVWAARPEDEWQRELDRLRLDLARSECRFSLLPFVVML